MADLVQVTNQLKTLNEKTEKLTTIISDQNMRFENLAKTLGTSDETKKALDGVAVVKNDDAVIDGQDETNNKGFTWIF